MASIEVGDSAVWFRFNNLVNEMVVSRNGRCMFPILNATIAGLEPEQFYNVYIVFEALSSHKMKWSKTEEKWIEGNCFSLLLSHCWSNCGRTKLGDRTEINYLSTISISHLALNCGTNSSPCSPLKFSLNSDSKVEKMTLTST